MLKETIVTVLINRKDKVSDNISATEVAIHDNNISIMKTINKIMKLKTGSKLFGYSYPAKAKQEKTIQNILFGVIKAIETQAADLKYVRDTVRSISKELPQPVVKQGPIILPIVKSPFLPQLKDEVKTKTYTLVLDLDETLVHYCEVSRMV